MPWYPKGMIWFLQRGKMPNKYNQDISTSEHANQVLADPLGRQTADIGENQGN
jgi:hypothetical protein